MMKSRITTIITLDHAGNISHQYISLVQKFNRLGLPVSEKACYANGDIQHKTLFKYNKRGKLIEKAAFEADDQLITRIDCFYDENNQLIQTEITAADESKLIKEHYFDRIENFEKVVVNSEHGEILGYEVYWFGKKGQLVAEIKSNASQQVAYKRFATYDTEGRLLMEEFFGHGEQLQKKVTYSYAPNDKLSQIVTCYQDEPNTLTEQFSYDSKQRLAKKSIVNQKKRLETKSIYFYDLNDHQVRVETYQREQLVCKNITCYDAKGNLIEEEMISSGDRHFHEIRKYDIQYW